jgi:arginyl-tRNA synthetase
VTKIDNKVKPFIGIFVKKKIFYETAVKKVLELGCKFGSSRQEKPQRIVVEHTSANPNGPLHIGNLRNVMIGSHLAKLLRFVGNKVEEFYFVNDIGYHYVFNDSEYQSTKKDHFIGRIYSIMNTFDEIQKASKSLKEMLKFYQERVPNPNLFELNDQVEDEITDEKDSNLLSLKLISLSLYRRSSVLFTKLADLFEDKNISELASELNIRYDEKDQESVKIIRKMSVDCLSASQKTLDIFKIRRDEFDFESEISWDGTTKSLMEIVHKSIISMSKQKQKDHILNLMYF